MSRTRLLTAKKSAPAAPAAPTPLCDEEGCRGEAVGFIPFGADDGRDRRQCARHYDEAQARGLFTCLSGERVCPVCEGRYLNAREERCQLCHNTGIISAATPTDLTRARICSRCHGRGYVGRPGRYGGLAAQEPPEQRATKSAWHT